jgi:hypothetical protein
MPPTVVGHRPGVSGPGKNSRGVRFYGELLWRRRRESGRNDTLRGVMSMANVFQGRLREYGPGVATVACRTVLCTVLVHYCFCREEAVLVVDVVPVLGRGHGEVRT